MFGWLRCDTNQPFPGLLVDRKGGHPRAAGSYRAVLYSPSVFGPVSTAPETVTEDRWHQPVSQPYPYLAVDEKGGHPRAAGSYRAALYSPSLFAPVSTLLETVSVDRWAQATSQPVRLGWRDDVYNAASTLSFPATVVPVVTMEWAQPTSEPTRKAFSWAVQDNDGAAPVFTGPETVTLDRWAQPTSQPYFPKVWNRAVFASTLFSPVSVDPENVTIDRWQQPTSQPTRKAFSWATFDNDGGVAPVSTSPETVTEDRWHQPASQPYPRSKFGAATYQQNSWVPFVAAAAPTVTLEWMQPISQPYPARAVRLQSDLAWVVSTAPETVSEDRWHQPASQPYLKAKYVSAVYTPIALTPFVAPAFTSLLDWVQPTNQPHPVRPTRPMSGAFSVVSTSPETVSVDRWAQPTNQPVRTQWRRDVYTPVSLAPFVATATTVSLEWAQPTSQPVRAAWRDDVYASSASVVSTLREAVTADRWSQPISQPTRRLVSVGNYLGTIAFALPDAPVDSGPKVMVIDTISVQSSMTVQTVTLVVAEVISGTAVIDSSAVVTIQDEVAASLDNIQDIK